MRGFPPAVKSACERGGPEPLPEAQSSDTAGAWSGGPRAPVEGGGGGKKGRERGSRLRGQESPVGAGWLPDVSNNRLELVQGHPVRLRSKDRGEGRRESGGEGTGKPGGSSPPAPPLSSGSGQDSGVCCTFPQRVVSASLAEKWRLLSCPWCSLPARPSLPAISAATWTQISPTTQVLVSRTGRPRTQPLRL